MRDDVVQTTALASVSGMADLSATTVADRYRLSAPLGQGAAANVYRAVDLRLNRDVAVKLFHPGQDAAVRVRFGAEAQALARLSHPGLIGIFDAGVDEADRPYLVMELIDGESLRDRLLSGPLTTDEVVLLGGRLAAGLAHVHGHGVVHRDIKPSNIVLDSQGAPHLADFGIALLLDAARMTGSNEILGTAAYLSPEQILGESVGSPADVYSLGLVLLECLTGELEYPGASKVESALARLHRMPRMPVDIPDPLAELLTAMTALLPGDRPTAAQCVTRLWAIRDGIGRNRLTALTGRLHGRWRRLAIAGSGLAVAIVASVWMLTSLMPHTTPTTPPDTARHADANPHGARPGVPNDGMPAAGQVMVVGAGSTAAQGTTTASPSGQGQVPQDNAQLSSNLTGPSATANPTDTTPVPLVVDPATTTDPAATTTQPATGKGHPKKNKS